VGSLLGGGLIFAVAVVTTGKPETAIAYAAVVVMFLIGAGLLALAARTPKKGR
jgi:hypothetical protein